MNNSNTTQVKSFDDFLNFKNKEIFCGEFNIPKPFIEQFSRLTDDSNDYQFTPPPRSSRPAVSELFSLVLFKKFHKTICRMENVNFINLRVLYGESHLAVHAEEKIVPVLKIESASKDSEANTITALWQYELRDLGSQCYFSARFELVYHFKTQL